MFHILEEIDNLEHKKVKKLKKRASENEKLGKLNFGSLTDLASPLFRKPEPLTAGMKPKYIKVSEQLGSDDSPCKTKIVLEDEKGENESISDEKVSKISSTIEEIKSNMLANLE